MTPESFLNDRVMLHSGDSLDVLARIDEGSIDSVVTDPPYHLTSIVKRFGAANAAPAKSGATGAYKRASAGFMGKQWDGGDIAFRTELWALVLRALKPGGHVLAFSSTRTYHRMACAIEDAGFEIRDQIGWAYGSGFPKSHDVSKGIDKALGAERKKMRIDAASLQNPPNLVGGANKGADRPWRQEALKNGFHEAVSDEAVSDEAVGFQGWGTALKPAWEPIVLARKPLIGTVADNVLAHGTGALNIDGTRIGLVGGTPKSASHDKSSTVSVGSHLNAQAGELNGKGRWPANIIHDGSDEVMGAFPESSSGALTADQQINGGWKGTVNCYGSGERGGTNEYAANSGSAARFFYTAKADAMDRLGSKHPTVKPLDLMQYLVRLVTPPGGTVLDCFAGTGTTGEAAWREGFSAVLIEREPEYQNDIRRRMKLALGGPEERQRESIKARGLTADAGPLFGGTEVAGGGHGRQIYGHFADQDGR